MILGGYGYMADGPRWRKVDLSTGAVTTVAGSGVFGCQDDTNSAQVTFQPASPATTDGTYIYFVGACYYSYNTALRRLTPSTGAVTTIATTGTTSPFTAVTVGADGELYVAQNAAISRVNTSTGALTQVVALPDVNGDSTRYAAATAMAADGTYLWVSFRVNCAGGDTGRNCDGLYRVTLSTGATTLAQVPVSNTTPLGYTRLVSAGDYLYGARGTIVSRFAKSSGVQAVIAGASVYGYIDATGSEARFGGISGIDTDGTNLYVTESNNVRVRKLAAGTALTNSQPAAWSTSVSVAPAAAVALVAGSGTSANTDGTGSAASFTYPAGIIVQGSYGYVPDSTHWRKVNLATGAVTTFAGSGTSGCTDSSDPAQAEFTASPTPALAASDGTFIYFVGACYYGYNTAVRRMSLSTGAVSTIAITDTTSQYTGLTIAPDGHVIVAQGSKITSIDSVNLTSTDLVTLPDLGPGQYPNIIGLAADRTYVWATVRVNCASGGDCRALDKVNATTGAVTQVLAPASGNDTSQGHPWALPPLVSAGNYLYFRDGPRLVRLTKSDGLATPVPWTDGGLLETALSGTGPTAGMSGMAFYGSSLYVADSSQRRLYRLTQAPATGTVLPFEGAGGRNTAENYCSACTGSPVELSTGDQFDSTTDIAVPGRGVPLTFTRTYDTRRRAVNGRLGYGWSDSYDWLLSVDTTSSSTAGQVTIRQDNGSQTVFSPNGAGGYTAPARVLAVLVHNSDGTWTYTIRRSRSYRFSSTGKLTAITDLNGYTTTLTYDANARLTTVTEPAGRTLTFAYDTAGRLSTVTDPLPRTATYGYDTAGNLSSVTDVDNRTSTLGYDTGHRLTTMTDPRANSITTSYDTSGRVSTQTDRRGKTTTFTYAGPASDGSTTTTVTRPRGRNDVYTFLNGRILQVTSASGTAVASTTAYTYDPDINAVTSVTDGRGKVTNATFDRYGNRLTATDPLNRSTTWTYNAFNEPLTVTDPLGVTTTNTYDATGNPLTTSRPLTGTSPAQTATLTYAYGDTAHPGDVTTLTDATGKVTTYSYDTNGNTTAVTDPTARKTTTTYNAAGWATSTVLPAGNATGGTPSQHQITYSAFTGFGAPKTVTDPLGKVTTYAFDADQNLTDVTDPDTRHTTTSYDGENHPLVVTRPDTTTQSSSYDDNGNLTAQTDGLTHATTYTYDALDRPASTTDALTRTTSYNYDATGNLTTITAPAASGTGTVTTTRIYDDAGQVTGISHSDTTTPNVTYTYDANGQRATMADGTGTTTYTIDSLHRLKTYTNGAGKTVTYGYDLAGRPTTIAYPGGVGTVTRGYDDAGRLTSVRDWLAHTNTFGYDTDGNWASTTYGNGVTAARTYDAADRLGAINYANGATNLGTYTYTRTNAGLLATTTPANGAPGTTDTYAYTPNGQLKATTGSAATNIWTYDAADRLTKNPANTTFGYDNADQLTTSTPSAGTATTYTYDQRGNRLTSKIGTGTPTTYTYDQENRLTGRTPSTGTAYTNTYNGDGLRAAKTPAGSATQTMTWDPVTTGLPLLLANTITNYLYGPGGVPIEQIRSTTATYLHGDQLNSTRLITLQTGAVDGTYTYDPYGKATSQTGATTTALQYNGQYTDPESGLIYLRARYYDPTSGQFLTTDPLANITRTKYSYVGGDPLNNTDPSGLDWLDDASSWAAGFGDTVTFGGTSQIRRLINYEVNGEMGDMVDHCSVFYQWGGYGGDLAQFFDLPAGAGAGLERAGLLKGQEIVFGKNVRLAPLGGSKPRNPTEFFPHYHRRGPLGVNGQTVPGQGLGRHRPWQFSDTDSSFWDRF